MSRRNPIHPIKHDLINKNEETKEGKLINKNEETKEGKLINKNEETTESDSELCIEEEEKKIKKNIQSKKIKNIIIKQKYNFLYVLGNTKVIIIQVPWFLKGSGIILIMSLIYLFFFRNNPIENLSAGKSFDVNVKKPSYRDIELAEDLVRLKEDFPIQVKASWTKFSAGIKKVAYENPNKPSVFLLMFKDDNDKNTASCLATKVAQIAGRYLRGTTIQPIVLESQILGKTSEFLEDSGKLITAYNSSVYKTGAMLVTELHQLPASIAKALHFFCDRESPLVESAVYLFTLKYNVRGKNLQMTAEKTLQNLWGKSMLDNELDPLITRLTGYVLEVEEENNLVNCIF